MNSKNKYISLFFLLGIVSIAVLIVSGCERDDICAADTATTPLLIIKFFDNVTRIDTKIPPNLSVRSSDQSADVEGSYIYNANLDSISIPLRTDADITDFRFTINTDQAEENIDSLSFEYTTVEEYISSACGFKVNYEGLTNTLIEEEGGTNWIREVVIQELNITDENTTHIFIYH